MPDESIWNQLICQMHQSEHQAVLAITGGGSAAISELLQVPGASSTVLEAVVPYANSALTRWLGTAADQSCCEQTARAMAMAAWMRARRLAPDSNPKNLIGLGATASLASDRPKQGEHRIHVAVQTSTETKTCSLLLAKHKRTRSEEETIASQLVLLVLADACSGVEKNDAKSHFDQLVLPGETLEYHENPSQPQWTNLLLGDRSVVCYPATVQPRAIFSGAFNPPHAGHRGIVRHAELLLGSPVAYELSITNVDKPPLDFQEIETRLNALRREDPSATTVLTDAPTFRRKAQLFPGCMFVVGTDTIGRVGEPKYYTGAEGSFDAAIQQIANAGCRFLVFGRKIEGEFRVLSDINLPPALTALCDEVSAEEFRKDLTSTELRTSKVGK